MSDECTHYACDEEGPMLPEHMHCADCCETEVASLLRERDRLGVLLTLYRVKRSVDGGEGRCWDATIHYDAEQALAGAGEKVFEVVPWENREILREMVPTAIEALAQVAALAQEPAPDQDQPLLDAVARMTPEDRLRLNDYVRSLLAGTVPVLPEERLPEEIGEAIAIFDGWTYRWSVDAVLREKDDPCIEASKAKALKSRVALESAILAALRRARKDKPSPLAWLVAHHVGYDRDGNPVFDLSEEVRAALRAEFNKHFEGRVETPSAADSGEESER